MKSLQKNKQKGITLIALVITIVILIILAGVAINLSFGENGLFNRAKYAKQEYEIAQEKEKLDTKIAEVQIEKEGKATINDVVEALKNETGVTYYIAGNKIAAVTTIGVISDKPKELYVVCNDKYQFKVEENLNTKFISIVDVEKIGEVVPPATEDTKVGTNVKTPSNWKTETPDYVEVESGKIITKSSEVASVYAVSVGGKDVVPIPKGFYYVGGNLQTGVVISDNEDDAYTKNERNMAEDGDVINLKGNQFVWIPCTIENYKKTTNFTKATPDSTWGNKAQDSNYDTFTNAVEGIQIQKYGGFYVARYEAGTSDIKGIDFANITTTTWKSDATSYTKITGGNVTSKANEIPYYHTDYITAFEMSKRMYKDDEEKSKYVSAGLITGTMWDVMLNVMNAKVGCNLSSCKEWGNYLDTEWTISRGLYCETTASTGHGAWKKASIDSNYKKEKNARAIFSTASNSSFEKYHIYDVAGNLWEWTEEMAVNNDNTIIESYILRGGSFFNSNSSSPASIRSCATMDGTNTVKGFRTALFIK